MKYCITCKTNFLATHGATVLFLFSILIVLIRAIVICRLNTTTARINTVIFCNLHNQTQAISN